MRARFHLILLLAFFGFTASAHSVVQHEGYYEVEHSWEYNKKNCTISLNISKSLYNYFQNEREHLAYRYQFEKDELPSNYYSFMLSEHDRPVMQALANEFGRNAVTDLEKMKLALKKRWCQAVTTLREEYPHTSVETLCSLFGELRQWYYKKSTFVISECCLKYEKSKEQ